MSELTIRPGEPEDAGELASVQREAALTAFASIFPPEVPKPTPASLQEGWAAVVADPAARVLVAEAAGVVVGGAAVRPDDAEWLLARLYVRPDRWGEGIGAALHDAALSVATELGAAELRLWVLEANQSARRMYERRGWRLVPGAVQRPHGPDGPPEVQYAREVGG